MLQLSFSIPSCDPSIMELFSYYHMDPANTLLFDIETTGFSAKTCTLYLIGAAVYQGDGMFTGIQWFNESGSQEEEKELLSAFFSFCQSYGTLLHYNGDGFDLPYLKNCAKKHALTPPFSYMQSFDLYKMIRPLKELFKTDSLKLKSIEQFLHISREDRFSGGELIKVYQNYCKHPAAEQKELLLLHNADDIRGLLLTLPILAYPAWLDGAFTIDALTLSGTHAVFTLALKHPLSTRVSLGKEQVTVTAYEKEARLTVPLYSGELKYFYKDYKNYYYLPLEDTAIHKSIATYVDKDYRQKATKETCYIKKSGIFLSQDIPLIEPCFKVSFEDKTSYFEIEESTSLDSENLKEYVLYLLKNMLSKH